MAGLDSFIEAIKQQESGGDYSAGNPSGAIGAYQILGSNVGPWSQQYLGRAVSIDQFRSSPAIQDQLAKAVLGSYYQKYGAAGAASAWYSGNPNAYQSTAAQKGGPSIAGYVNSVLARMEKGVTADLSNQPADSPLNPWTQGEVPTYTPPTVKAPVTTAVGLGAADGSDTGAAGQPVGLDKADGAETAGTPSTVLDAPAAATPQPKASSTTTSGDSSAGAQNASYSVGSVGGMRGAALDLGQKYLGVPYVWGGTSQYGLDCSGLVQKVLGGIGISMPRASYAQLNMGPHVSVAQAKPGDLIGWGSGGHVALYVGNNQVLEEARPGTSARIRSLGDSWDNSQGYFAVSLDHLYKG